MNNKKLLFKWGDFEDNIKTSFCTIRNTNYFTDVTLAFECGRTIEAHRIVLAAASHVFTNILQGNNHPNLLIYMRSVSYDTFNNLMDFIYNGEVNIVEENLNNFLAVGQEFSLKGISDQIDREQSFPNNTSTFGQELKLDGPSNQYDSKEDLEELNLETNGFRVVPDTTDTQDSWGVDIEDSSGTNTNEHNSLSNLKNSLQPQLKNYGINNPKIKTEDSNDSNFGMHDESENELNNFGSFRCRVCGKSLTSNKALARHKYSHKSVECDICHKAIRATKLSIHKDKHTRYGDDAVRKTGFEDLDAKIEPFILRVDGVWTCQACDKKTARSKPDIRCHVEMHHMDLTIPCIQCGATFMNRETLRKHIARRCPAALDSE